MHFGLTSRIDRRTSSPVIPGIRRSRSTSSAGRCRSWFIASSPLTVVATSKPSARRECADQRENRAVIVNDEQSRTLVLLHVRNLQVGRTRESRDAVRIQQGWLQTARWPARIRASCLTPCIDVSSAPL